MLKKIKYWLKIIKWAYIITKWTYVYVIMNHHLKIFDFLYLLFKGFSYQYKFYGYMIVSYEILAVCLALYFIYFFVWKWTAHYAFFNHRIREVYYFITGYFLFIGCYFRYFKNALQNFELD